MHQTRLTILRLMGVVVLIAALLACLMRPNGLATACLETATSVVLLAAILGAIFTRGPRRAFWAGFALFGWFFMVGGPSTIPGDRGLDPGAIAIRELVSSLFEFMHSGSNAMLDAASFAPAPAPAVAYGAPPALDPVSLAPAPVPDVPAGAPPVFGPAAPVLAVPGAPGPITVGPPIRLYEFQPAFARCLNLSFCLLAATVGGVVGYRFASGNEARQVQRATPGPPRDAGGE